MKKYLALGVILPMLWIAATQESLSPLQRKTAVKSFQSVAAAASSRSGPRTAASRSVRITFRASRKSVLAAALEQSPPFLRTLLRRDRRLTIAATVPAVSLNIHGSSESSESSVSLESSLKFRILELVNIERSKENLPPVRWNDRLAEAAQLHVEDMEKRKYFAHKNPEGLSPSDRIKAAGYKAGCTGCRWSTSYGENIGRGQRSPGEVMRDWMASPGHRVNIMNPVFEELGVGVAGQYWGQEFGTIKTW